MRFLFNSKTITTGIVAGLLFSGALIAYQWHEQPTKTSLGASSQPAYKNALQHIGITHQKDQKHIRSRTDSGAYLSSLFSQRHQNWQQAAQYLDEIKRQYYDSSALLKKGMVFKIGANDLDGAIADAKIFLDSQYNDNGSNALAGLLVASEALKTEDYKTARTILKTIPDDGLTLFMKPILQGWLKAEKGQLDPTMLNGHSMHIYSAAAIADYLNKPKDFVRIADRIAQFNDLNAEEQERLADMYMSAKKTKKAKAIYNHLQTNLPLVARLKAKASSDAYQPNHALYVTPQSIQEGVATAIYDMAHLLYQDKSYDSAHIFINIAQYLAPNLPQVLMQQAGIATAFQKYDLALTAYSNIAVNSPHYNEAQLLAAKIYDQIGESDKAISLLKKFHNQTHDMNALIVQGDIYRSHKKFTRALDAYNAVITTYLNGEITAPFWHLHYVRGMVLEQLGRWDEAKADLEAALTFYPDHPFVLNYLGYAMADRGEDLDRSLELLEKALSMQPNDGYITDSLGWVYFKMGEFDKAVPYLEMAVEQMPGDATINDHLGDAYWQVGRKIEARYQWKRAKLDTDISAEALAQIDKKLNHGLHDGLQIIANTDKKPHTDTN